MSTQGENRLTDSVFWDNFWTNGKRSQRLSKRHRYFGQSGIFMSLMQKHLGKLTGRSVLELGGGGCNLRLLAMRRWGLAEVTAMDFSNEGLAQLKNLFSVHDEKVEVVEADIFDSRNIRANSFDFVCHWGVIEHFAPPTKVLEVSLEFLKPGGKLVFSLPNLNSFGATFFKKYSPLCWSKHVPYRNSELIAALKEVGFTDVKAQFFGYPAFKYYSWERSSWQGKILTVMQKLSSLSALVVPYQRFGSEAVSMELLLVATKPNEIIK